MKKNMKTLIIVMAIVAILIIVPIVVLSCINKNKNSELEQRINNAREATNKLMEEEQKMLNGK